MITPLDIENKEFSKGIEGYKEEEVDEFLDQLIVDYEKLINENNDLRAELNEAAQKLEEYKSTEGAVLQTLEAAKALMNDIAASAEKRAEILVKNAELDAELKQRQARESVDRLKEEEARLNRRLSSMRSKYKAMLENELSRSDDLAGDLFDSVEEASQADEPAKTSSQDELFRTLTNLRP